MTDIDALLPCPMCGDEARVCQWKDTVEPNATWIECPNCSVMTDTFYDPSPDEAIRNAASVWNRRVPLSADALTAEREKVAALEKENAKFRTMLGGSTALAEGLGIRTDAIMQEVALAAYKQLEEAKADTARWREVAGELAGIAERQHEELRMIRMKDCNAVYDTLIRTETQIALVRFKQESGE